MSFFIRKRGSSVTASRNSKPGNTEMKNRKSRDTSGRGRKAAKLEIGSDKNRFQGGRGGRGARRKAGIRGHDPGPTKKPKFDPNEEIVSSSDDEGKEDEGQEEDERSAATDRVEDDEIEETPQEKKIRLTKMYLDEIKREELERQESEDVDVDLLVTKRLREDILETEGRLRREVAESTTFRPEEVFSLGSPKHLKKSVTCLCISPDDEWIFSGDKDGQLFKWSLKEKKKVIMIKRKEKMTKRKQKQKGKIDTKSKSEASSDSCHTSAISSIAISSDGKFLATGDLDNQVVIWNPERLSRLHIFKGHRGPIRGLVFRHKTHTLYSSSDDRSVRIWSLDEMGYVETLFGHQDAVTSVDALARERAISSGGRDNSIRVWKIVEESQLVYNGHHNGSADVVKLVNEENFISGGDDGLLCAWSVNRKKPLASEQNAHGVETSGDSQYQNPRWISALAAWTNTDMIVSGSNDGFLRVWKCGDRFKTLTPVFTIPCQGWVNSIQFSHGNDIIGKFLAVGIGREHKSGRWGEKIEGAKNFIQVIPLCYDPKLPNGHQDQNTLKPDAQDEIVRT